MCVCSNFIKMLKTTDFGLNSCFREVSHYKIQIRNAIRNFKIRTLAYGLNYAKNVAINQQLV